MIACSCRTCLSTDPKDYRTRSSVFIQKNNTNLLIDVGPDFRHQALSAGIKDLDGVLLTHEHNDHIIGIDDLRPLNFIHKKEIPLFAEKRVIDNLKERFGYIFKEGFTVPALDIKEIKPSIIDMGSISVQAIRVMHGKLPILAFRIDSFAYVTDAKSIPDSELDKFNGLDVLIVNALRRSDHHKHFTLEEAIEFSQKVKAKKTYLTHLSHAFPPHVELSEELPENVFVAFDGLKLSV